MSLLICEGCSAAYSVGAPLCPQCGSTKSHGDWEDAPAEVEAAPVVAVAAPVVAPAVTDPKAVAK